MRKSLALWSVVLLGSMGVFAQTDIGLPSPTAANLGKVADGGLNAFSGRPNISIPITSIGGGDISLNVSLSYNASGVLVSEVPDWVGSGWSLNAGGVISRKVKGIPDETETKGYLTNYTQTRLGLVESKLPGGFTDGTNGTVDDRITTVGTGGNQDNITTILHKIYGGDLDSEPDVFYYNVNGMAGKFVLTPETTEGISIPQSDIKIEFQTGLETIKGESGQTILWFTIITPNGVKYTFNEREYALREPGTATGISEFEPAKAWYLTEISSPSGTNTITLSYSSPIEVVHKFNNELYELNSTTGDDYYYQYLERKYLEEIVFKDRKIVFNSGVRNDAPIPSPWDSYSGFSFVKEKRLANIELKATSGELIRKWVLTTTYDSNNYRLFLDSIVESDGNGNLLPPHEFSYITKNGLPDRLSKGIDHWGYYNGEGTYNASKGFISQGDWWNSFTDNYEYKNGAKRFVNTTTSQYGVLNKIISPLGGTIEYEYEQNRYYSIIHKNKVNITNYDTSVEVQAERHVDNMADIETESFYDAEVEHVTVTAKLYYTCNGSALDWGRLYIEDEVKALNHGYFNINYTLDGFTPDYTISCSEFNSNYTSGGQIYQPNGKYLGEQDIVLNDQNSPNNNFAFDFRDPHGSVTENDDTAYLIYEVNGIDSELLTNNYAPGLRVSKVTIKDGNTSTSDIIKQYSYQNK